MDRQVEEGALEGVADEQLELEDELERVLRLRGLAKGHVGKRLLCTTATSLNELVDLARPLPDPR